MDLSMLNTADSSEEGAWMEVLDFDYETPLGCAICLIGPDSMESLRISDEEEKATQKKFAEALTQNKKTAPDDESSVDKAIRKAVRITKTWKNIDWFGKELPCTKENAEMLYTKIPHIRNQVLAFNRDRLNFTKPEYRSWRTRFGQDSSSNSQEREGRASDNSLKQ